MAIWAIADLHLSFGVPNKKMDIFGSNWENHAEKIEKNWKQTIANDDLVLIAGDFSWAMHIPDEIIPDFEWIDRLPGTKILLKGNHDYWWSSLSKLKGILPTSCRLLQNNSITWQDVSIGGARLWDIPGINYHDLITYNPSPKNSNSPLTHIDTSAEAQKIYQRELGRLETSLKSMNPQAKVRIAMTHYPPIGPSFQETEASLLLEKYKIDICIFGHLHNVKTELQVFGTHNHIQYYLTACDYLNHTPLKIL